MAGLTTLAAANAYLREHYLADYNEEFTRPPTDPASAFVPLGDVDLDQLLAEDGERLVGRDNVVSFEGVSLQVAEQPGRRSCAGLRVTVRRHLTGEHTVWRGPQCLGRYDAQGRPLDGPRPRLPKPLQPRPRPLRASRPKNAHAHLASEARPTRPPRSHHSPSRAIPRRRHGPRLPSVPVSERTDDVSKPSGHFICQQQSEGPLDDAGEALFSWVRAECDRGQSVGTGEGNREKTDGDFHA